MSKLTIPETTPPPNFIRKIMEEDRESGKFGGRVHTRFPPEPNGYLHLGHAKSLAINFGLAKDFGGLCNLRFDDTNPTKEEDEFTQAIIRDIRWLGYDWGDRLYYASDYFEQLYDYAVQLIKKGKAYVDSQNADEIREGRGTLTQPGVESPYRNRSVEENLDLFERMRRGEFSEGEHVLRAKIDMASPNLYLRDPVMYRILRATHHRTGNKWHIYPLYDWAHGQSDSIEGITHSLCTIEFEHHRPLYDWFLNQLEIHHPRQIEFAPLNLSYTIFSKRRLMRLVKEGHVNGWDDPRLPTLAGMRRRGYTPAAIRNFIERVGVAKKDDSLVDVALLQFAIREDLNKRAPRVMGVLRPLKVIITNYPQGQVEQVEAVNNPEDPQAGTRSLPFSRELYIERDDFKENAPRKWFRLAPGKEVRLKHAYYITCVDVIKNEAGEVVELHCTYDPETRGGWSKDGRKVRGTLHWVSAAQAIDAEVRLYDHLFNKPNPYEVEEGQDYLSNLNPNSLEVLTACKVEPGLAEAKAGSRFQFLRQGYFIVDPDSSPGHLVFNRTVPLRDGWAKIAKKAKRGPNDIYRPKDIE